MDGLHLKNNARYLSLDALNGVHNHGHGPLGQRLKALLCVNVDTRQPAAKTGVTVVPAYHHLWPAATATLQHRICIICISYLKQTLNLWFEFYLPVCFNMSNIFAWKTGSTASTLTPCQHNSHYTGKSKILTPLIKRTGWKTYDKPK